MKETYYFSHDYNARSDDKIKLLIRKHGIIGYGIYWCIIEDLYNNANALRTDYDGIAFDLRTDSEVVKSIINDFDLFVFDNDYFGSLSVERRINERNLKSSKARESALYRWSKKELNANAMRTQCDGNAIKEKKRKENKVNNRINNNTFDFSNYDSKFIPILKEWIEYKQARREKYVSQKSFDKFYNKLISLSFNNFENAKMIIDQSMANNYAGIFELKHLNNGKINPATNRASETEFLELVQLGINNANANKRN